MQFVLRALFNKTKDIKRDGVSAWSHGDEAIAIVQPYKDREAEAPVILRCVCFQRAERIESPHTGKLYYCIVLQKGYDRLVINGQSGNSIAQYLNFGRELVLLFSEVPAQDLLCCSCGFKKLGVGPACFVNGVARCSPYCEMSCIDSNYIT